MVVHKMKTYYCYVKDGKPIVLEIEPEGFKTLPYSKALLAPNDNVALMIYEADLKLINIRKGNGNGNRNK